MKYAPWVVADQTISYFREDGSPTLSPREAALFDTREKARSFAILFYGPRFDEQSRGVGGDVEEVEDVLAFRAQPDTWEA